MGHSHEVGDEPGPRAPDGPKAGLLELSELADEAPPAEADWVTGVVVVGGVVVVDGGAPVAGE
jgi:hypothetical protein